MHSALFVQCRDWLGPRGLATTRMQQLERGVRANRLVVVIAHRANRLQRHLPAKISFDHNAISLPPLPLLHRATAPCRWRVVTARIVEHVEVPVDSDGSDAYPAFVRTLIAVFASARVDGDDDATEF